jgi:biopolymer transport protein TolR
MPRRSSLRHNRLIAELNMTPLMDLTFLLLIAFIITFPLIEQGIHVRLPKGKTGEIDAATTHSITLDAEGRLFFDDAATDAQGLALDVKAKATANPDVTILVRADESLAYGKVVEIMRILHEANVTRMALVTVPD